MAQQMKAKRDDEVKDLNSCFFDSRIDSTLVPKKINGHVSNQTEKEEHYALVKEPGGKCFSHICPDANDDEDDGEDEDNGKERETKHGQKVAEAIDKEMTDLGIDKSKIVALGADSTYVNTGRDIVGIFVTFRN